MMNRIIKVILSSAAALLFAACNNDTHIVPQGPDGVSPLVIYMSIGGTGNVVSRATVANTDDLWSYTGFTNNDVMGFYSSGGNWLDPETGNFDNLELEYDDVNKRFTDLTNGVEFSPSEMNGSKIFMYFPYEKDMNGKGLELRVEYEDEDADDDDDDDSNGADDGEVDDKDDKIKNLRCLDFLSSNEIQLQGVVDGKKVALYGTFDHAFSELIIMRGEGFDRPPKGKERITAVVQEAYTHVRVELNADGEAWSCTPQLYFDEEQTELTKEEARRWVAWRGGNYGITNINPEGYKAWYIVIPTLGSQSPVGKKKDGPRTTVEYIELYDNEGYLQRVSGLRLSGGNTKYLDAGWRYPMEITMKELVPTVNPFRIVSWNDNVNLTDERERGINNESVFASWVRDYNAYLLDKEDQQKIDALLKYGDSFVDGDKRSWHFYVLADLDLSNYNPFDGTEDGTQQSNVIIPKLEDILDGVSTTLVDSKFINHTIKGLSKTFIDELSGDGLVQNFDFISPDVKNGESTSPAGIIVNRMVGTSVVNCNIDNGTMFNPAGPAGMVVGSMEGGIIKECTLEGFLGSSTFLTGAGYKIAGQVSGNATFADNDADAVTTNE